MGEIFLMRRTLAVSLGALIFALVPLSQSERASSQPLRHFVAQDGGAVAQQVGTDWPLVYGKYGCTASSFVNGGVSYSPKGSFTIEPNGTYVYNGFEKPSQGKFTIDEAGNLHFIGGYLNGGEATKIDRLNKFFVVAPTLPDNRWTAGLISD